MVRIVEPGSGSYGCFDAAGSCQIISDVRFKHKPFIAEYRLIAMYKIRDRACIHKRVDVFHLKLSPVAFTEIVRHLPVRADNNRLRATAIEEMQERFRLAGLARRVDGDTLLPHEIPILARERELAAGSLQDAPDAVYLCFLLWG
jgi:hypothetical protein